MKVCMWRIVPQIVKVKGVEIEVNCKQVLYFPKIDKTGVVTGFGRLWNGIYQVLIQRYNWKDGETWSVRYSQGRYSIVYGRSNDVTDAYSRRKEPGTVTVVVHKDTNLSADRVRSILKERVKDQQFIESIMKELKDASEGLMAA